jgi:hypothetical protein
LHVFRALVPQGFWSNRPFPAPILCGPSNVYAQNGVFGLSNSVKNPTFTFVRNAQRHPRSTYEKHWTALEKDPWHGYIKVREELKWLETYAAK